jgi:hypothetical protein
MQEVNLFGIFVDVLNKNSIQYFVTGSVAAIVYGEPRLTHVIDLVVHIDEQHLDSFVSAFDAASFYCPPREVIKAELNRIVGGHFNLIHHETGFKADIYLAGKEELQWWAMNNIQKIDMSGMVMNVAPPEYVIIKKLEYFKEGKSQKHLNDIDVILSNSGESINFEFLRGKIVELGLDSVGKNIRCVVFPKSYLRTQKIPI